MKRFTNAGREAIKGGNLYCALSLALMMQDICASLEDPGPGISKARCVRWFKVWGEPKFTTELGPARETHVFVSAEDCYQLRCSLIHSGTSDIEPDKQDILARFEFFERGTPHLNWVQDHTVNGVKIPNFLQLDAARFSETMFVATDEWNVAIATDAKIQAEKKRLLLIKPMGTAIGGIKFG